LAEFTVDLADHVSVPTAREFNSAPEPPCGLIQQEMRGLPGKADSDNFWLTARIEDADRVGKAGRPRFASFDVKHLTAKLFNVVDLLPVELAKLGPTKVLRSSSLKCSLWHPHNTIPRPDRGSDTGLSGGAWVDIPASLLSMTIGTWYRCRNRETSLLCKPGSSIRPNLWSSSMAPKTSRNISADPTRSRRTLTHGYSRPRRYLRTNAL